MSHIHDGGVGGGMFKPPNHKKKSKERKYDGDFRYTGDTLEVSREGKSRGTLSEL